MKNNTFLQTFFSRILILVINFSLVIYTTHVWGSEGRGVISLVIADLTLISFLSNIFVGSSVSFFASKCKKEEILLYSYLWSLVSGLFFPLIFAIIHPLPYSLHLVLLSILFSLLTANINFFVGIKQLKAYNLFTVLQQLFHILLMFFIILILKTKSIAVYFNTQIITYAVLFVISSFLLLKDIQLSNIRFSKNVRNKLFEYGWKSQLSNFIQFLNYRLSYYFLEFYKGLSSVGVFSIGVAFSEAIWTVSKSLSVILYSEVVNNESRNESIEKTKIALRISFLVSILCLLILLILPSEFFVMLFGESFSQTKKIILFLSPGILAIASSNILGFYFAGIKQLKILNFKSFFGLFITLFASVYAIPKWGVLGASIVSSVSYCISSAVLFWYFYKDTRFQISDLWITKTEFNLLLQKIIRNK